MINFRIEHFLKDFIEEGPRTAMELEIFYRLGHLYMSCDLPEVSKEVFRKIVAANPTYRDTVEILGALEVELMSEAMEAFGEVVQQDEEFRGGGSTGGPSTLDEALPDLPDLPDLPELPPTQGPGAPLQGGEALARPTVSSLAQPAPAQVAPPQAPAPIPTQAPAPIPTQAPAPIPTQASPQVSTQAPAQVPTQASPQIPANPERPEGARGPGIPTSMPAGGVAPSPAAGTPPPQLLPPGAAAPTVGLPSETASAEAPMTLGMGGPVPQPGLPQPTVADGGLVALQPGALIANRYRLEAELGKGGSASVFRATDLELDEEVALKFLAKPRENPADFERFRRELKLTRQLTHPNVIRVHDIGVHQQYSYLSMELLKGKSLFELMLGELDLEDGLTYLIQACGGLQAAHDLGVVHRDVKPGNIFVTEDEVAKVMDFGIARQRHVPGVTVHGRTFGTPEYMAPEQIRSGSDVTTATDLYAMGVTLYEVCTGQVPFQHPEAMPLMMMHLEQLPRPPRELAPGLPASLEQVILQLLEKEPSQRIPSCSVLARQLRQIRQEYRNSQR
jgi:serine/threonine-protein kinase